ncbi:hypothetical protein E2C01_030321 [Portunus trituberculatus]|uniref:Uncharacterized protein n=1 Tax=Portunus trituberculatus TaxID=210409 RepID=A0A5B7EX03_PORTR|nr:hypothetical protein [Portunus trituberculatus]
MNSYCRKYQIPKAYKCLFSCSSCCLQLVVLFRLGCVSSLSFTPTPSNVVLVAMAAHEGEKKEEWQGLWCNEANQPILPAS